MVREETDAGTCVLYTTHYMEEAQSLCRRLAIVDHGKVIALGTLEELRDMVGERDILQLTGSFDPEAMRRALGGRDDTEIVTAEKETLVLAAEGASKRLPALFAAVTGAGGEIRETTLRQPSLETLFIKLTGRELRE
jgi:ABC-2 type transport system ATP-binding protein